MKRLAFTSSLALTVGLPGAGAPVTARAQSAPAGSDPAATAVPAAPSGSDDIIVTARRREERLQDVPVAITALAGESLRAANIVQVQDVQLKVPGLTIQASAFGSNVLQVAIRGQRQFDPYITKDPAVAVYFADVVQNRPQGLNSGLFDIESIQVLKGPQGTLFGRNTTGGAMLIAPVAPSDRFDGYVTVGYGNYDAKRLEGAINVPLTDWAQARFAGALQRRNGFTNNVTTGQKLDDEHKDNWRASLKLTPFEGFENRTVINGFKASENGIGYRLSAVLPGVGFGSAPNVVAALARLNALPFHSTTSDLILHTDIKTFAISNVTQYEIGPGVTIKNIAGYRYVESHIPFDFDGSDLTFTDGRGRVVPYFASREDMTDRQYSNELQLLGTVFDGNLDYILGGFYFLEKGSDKQTTGGQGGVTIGGVYQGERVTFADPVRNESHSAFAQLTYRLPFLSGVSLTAGGRETHDKRALTTRNMISNGVCRLVDQGGIPLNPCQAFHDVRYSRFTYTLSADWKIARDLLVYVAHRKGYRSGGFNISATTPLQFTPFRPEDVKDVEIGLKTGFSLGTGRGSFNVAAYSQDYKDIQRNQGGLINGIFTQTIVNAASARIKGFEVELQLHPAHWIDFGTNVAHIDARYKEWISNGADLSRSMFAGAPRWTISSNLGFNIPAGSLGEVGIRGDLYRQSRANQTDNNFLVAQNRVSPTSILPPYTLINARLELRNIRGSAITAALWARNLTDREYLAGGTDLATTGLGYTADFLGAPRTYGAEVTFRF